MADSTNSVKELIGTLFKGMDGFVSSKTVIGEPVKVGNATLVPLIEVSCGMGAGGFANDRERKNGNGGAGAMSSRITPTAILVMQNGNMKLVNIKNQDAVTKVLDMLPDVLDHFTGGNRITRDAEEAAEEMLTEEERELIHDI